MVSGSIVFTRATNAAEFGPPPTLGYRLYVVRQDNTRTAVTELTVEEMSNSRQQELVIENVPAQRNEGWVVVAFNDAGEGPDSSPILVIDWGRPTAVATNIRHSPDVNAEGGRVTTTVTFNRASDEPGEGSPGQVSSYLLFLGRNGVPRTPLDILTLEELGGQPGDEASFDVLNLEIEEGDEFIILAANEAFMADVGGVLLIDDGTGVETTLEDTVSGVAVAVSAAALASMLATGEFTAATVAAGTETTVVGADPRVALRVFADALQIPVVASWLQLSSIPTSIRSFGEALRWAVLDFGVVGPVLDVGTEDAEVLDDELPANERTLKQLDEFEYDHEVYRITDNTTPQTFLYDVCFAFSVLLVLAGLFMGLQKLYSLTHPVITYGMVYKAHKFQQLGALVAIIAYPGVITAAFLVVWVGNLDDIDAALAVMLLLFFGIALPVASFVYYGRYANEPPPYPGDQPPMPRPLEPIYGGMRQGMCWYTVFSMWRRTALVVVIVCFMDQPFLQCCIALGVFLTVLLLNAFFRPYQGGVRSVSFWLENAIFTLAAIICIAAIVTHKADKSPNETFGKTIVILYLIVLAILFLVLTLPLLWKLWKFLFVVDAQASRQQRHKKVQLMPPPDVFYVPTWLRHSLWRAKRRAKREQKRLSHAEPSAVTVDFALRGTADQVAGMRGSRRVDMAVRGRDSNNIGPNGVAFRHSEEYQFPEGSRATIPFPDDETVAQQFAAEAAQQERLNVEHNLSMLEQMLAANGVDPHDSLGQSSFLDVNNPTQAVTTDIFKLADTVGKLEDLVDSLNTDVTNTLASRSNYSRYTESEMSSSSRWMPDEMADELKAQKVEETLRALKYRVQNQGPARTEDDLLMLADGVADLEVVAELLASLEGLEEDFYDGHNAVPTDEATPRAQAEACTLRLQRLAAICQSDPTIAQSPDGILRIADGVTDLEKLLEAMLEAADKQEAKGVQTPRGEIQALLNRLRMLHDRLVKTGQPAPENFDLKEMADAVADIERLAEALAEATGVPTPRSARKQMGAQGRVIRSVQPNMRRPQPTRSRPNIPPPLQEDSQEYGPKLARRTSPGSRRISPARERRRSPARTGSPARDVESRVFADTKKWVESHRATAPAVRQNVPHVTRGSGTAGGGLGRTVTPPKPPVVEEEDEIREVPAIPEHAPLTDEAPPPPPPHEIVATGSDLTDTRRYSIPEEGSYLEQPLTAEDVAGPSRRFSTRDLRRDSTSEAVAAAVVEEAVKVDPEVEEMEVRRLRRTVTELGDMVQAMSLLEPTSPKAVLHPGEAERIKTAAELADESRDTTAPLTQSHAALRAAEDGIVDLARRLQGSRIGRGDSVASLRRSVRDLESLVRGISIDGLSGGASYYGGQSQLFGGQSAYGDSSAVPVADARRLSVGMQPVPLHERQASDRLALPSRYSQGPMLGSVGRMESIVVAATSPRQPGSASNTANYGELAPIALSRENSEVAPPSEGGEEDAWEREMAEQKRHARQLLEQDEREAAEREAARTQTQTTPHGDIPATPQKESVEHSEPQPPSSQASRGGAFKRLGAVLRPPALFGRRGNKDTPAQRQHTSPDSHEQHDDPAPPAPTSSPRQQQQQHEPAPPTESPRLSPISDEPSAGLHPSPQLRARPVSGASGRNLEIPEHTRPGMRASSAALKNKRGRGFDAVKYEAAKVFESIDANGDGFITEDELMDALGISKMQARAIIQETEQELYGRVEDGKLTLEEFRTILNKLVQTGGEASEEMSEKNRKRYRIVFDALDTDGNGVLTADEIATDMGVDTGDMDQHAELTFDDFCRVLHNAENTGAQRTLAQLLSETHHGASLARAVSRARHIQEGSDDNAPLDSARTGDSGGLGLFPRPPDSERSATSSFRQLEAALDSDRTDRSAVQKPAREAFMESDINHDGVLDPAELAEALRACVRKGVLNTDPQLLEFEVMRICDEAEVQSFDYEDFVTVLRDLQTTHGDRRPSVLPPASDDDDDSDGGEGHSGSFGGSPAPFDRAPTAVDMGVMAAVAVEREELPAMHEHGDDDDGDVDFRDAYGTL